MRISENTYEKKVFIKMVMEKVCFHWDAEISYTDDYSGKQGMKMIVNITEGNHKLFKVPAW